MQVMILKELREIVRQDFDGEGVMWKRGEAAPRIPKFRDREGRS